MTIPVLAGVGHYFPGTPIPNSFFEALSEVDIDDAWIRRHTGVRTRHWPDTRFERHAEMAREAALMACKTAEVAIEDIDLIIGTTATARPRVNPTMLGNNYMDLSLPVQSLLGARQALCFDITAVACAGFLHASVVANSLIRGGRASTALILCAENPQPILNFGYRNSALFGGGAAAAVWRQAPEADEHAGIHDVVLYTDSEHYQAFDIDDEDKMLMKGKVVGDLGPRLITDAARELLDRNGLTSSDVDWYVPHQGNVNMIHPVARALELPETKILMNLADRGNTSSVGIPSCLSEHVHRGTVRPGDTVLALGIGRGFGWGAMLFRYQ
ncbi:ketoacyl-ACP synthase III [Amycolatopsis anabasis]|uniref:ketoacyl-ACP synthase III n=1 Tax=Amycolatopsis anabasis TaxID=1840409 RepID=UPI001C555C9F|nr:ketoacyl-ACP synthase III [Amycolatopsis anabasis]